MERAFRDQCRLHLEALALLAWARWRLQSRGWQKSIDEARRLEREMAIAADNGQGGIDVGAIELALHRASRLIPGVTCIHRALAGQRILGRRGEAAKLVIGLRKSEDALEGHAWLELREGAQKLFVEDGAGYQEVEGI